MLKKDKTRWGLTCAKSSGAETEQRRKCVLATVNYIENDWNGIENGVKNLDIDCSAEGHVCHILSARLSSRPKAWSQQGIRLVRANDESVQEYFLAMC